MVVSAVGVPLRWYRLTCSTPSVSKEARTHTRSRTPLWSYPDLMGSTSEGCGKSPYPHMRLMREEGPHLFNALWIWSKFVLPRTDLVPKCKPPSPFSE